MTNKKVKVSIIGVTGFTGMELLRCLLHHPYVEIVHLASRQHDKTPLAQVFPRLSHLSGLVVDNIDYDTLARDSDVVFACLPHGAAQDVVPLFLDRVKIIDMSADFRLNESATYKKYYKEEHKRPDLLSGRFVYGAPEIFREKIAKADAVANPGCFALLAQLMLYPFKGRMDHADIIGISGTTGGGRSPRDPVDHPALSQNMRSYLINEHRHTPEILITSGLKVEQMNFAPTVGPFLRGIFAHAIVRASQGFDLSVYAQSPFIRVIEKVELTNVVSTNFTDLSYRDGHNGTVIIQGALDNLLKGASGTAVQNMNLMCGLPEDAGLNFNSPIYP